jgi:hypothetical protein
MEMPLPKKHLPFKLLANAESIVDEPGNANAKLVARSGEGRLNFLQVGRSPGILSCECEGFKEKGGICSHTVAVAEITGYLRQHLSTYQKGQQLNITRLTKKSWHSFLARNQGKELDQESEDGCLPRLAAQVHLQRKWLVLLHLIMTPTK